MLINRSNAADYPPPSLNGYRTPASRADPGCPPAVWFRQMTGTDDWASTDPPCDSKLYEHEKKRHRRMANEDYKAKEKERLFLTNIGTGCVHTVCIRSILIEICP